jgi:hypothetical protein
VGCATVNEHPSERPEGVPSLFHTSYSRIGSAHVTSHFLGVSWNDNRFYIFDRTVDRGSVIRKLGAYSQTSQQEYHNLRGNDSSL